MTRRVAVVRLALVGLAAALSTSCGSSSPTTKTEVCTSFDELGAQLLKGNGIIGNPLFKQAKKTGDIAKRFPGPPSLGADAAALQRIADSNATDSNSLRNATQNMAALCGHPLGLGASTLRRGS